MDTGKDQSLLQLRNVRKIFARGTIDEVTALDGISLDVYPEEFVTVIGSNGAGKSTLLNIIAGVFPPETGGKLIINGDDLTELSEYKHAAYVGRVWQDPGVGTAGKLTIEENLSLALLRGIPRGLRPSLNKGRRELFRSALAPLGLELEDRLSTLAGTLSGGQRQALALVMATISKPALLLLDEHIATLDPRTAQTVLNLSDMIVQRERMTTIMVTHNMELALRYGNRLIMMHKGRIIVDIGQQDKQALTINDLVTAFE
ncbi:MAG: ATP-binding cassette domain-containing protein, partial [Dehalococcoidia bacterium]|nr:ATP-binding cassette domain-containing protein [Dehalococcoidia bacterium]